MALTYLGFDAASFWKGDPVTVKHHHRTRSTLLNGPESPPISKAGIS